LTKEEMKKCVWVRPELVAQVEFAEWTRDGDLRHSTFVGLRDDKDPRDVVREEA
jgi:bifunctional non-homologous end joining protein LigD